MHRYADRSAGLHLFQELSTLGQQLAHTLLFRTGLRQSIAHVSSEHAPTAPALQRCAVGTGAAVHTASSMPSPGADTP
jgi:hypothetical protein